MPAKMTLGATGGAEGFSAGKPTANRAVLAAMAASSVSVAIARSVGPTSCLEKVETGAKAGGLMAHGGAIFLEASVCTHHTLASSLCRRAFEKDSGRILLGVSLS